MGIYEYISDRFNFFDKYLLEFFLIMNAFYLQKIISELGSISDFLPPSLIKVLFRILTFTFLIIINLLFLIMVFIYQREFRRVSNSFNLTFLGWLIILAFPSFLYQLEISLISFIKDFAHPDYESLIKLFIYLIISLIFLICAIYKKNRYQELSQPYFYFE